MKRVGEGLQEHLKAQEEAAAVGSDAVMKEEPGPALSATDAGSPGAAPSAEASPSDSSELMGIFNEAVQTYLTSDSHAGVEEEMGLN